MTGTTNAPLTRADLAVDWDRIAARLVRENSQMAGTANAPLPPAALAVDWDRIVARVSLQAGKEFAAMLRRAADMIDPAVPRDQFGSLLSDDAR